jgi:predicted DNA-binding transcriptional regulator AlpA
MTRHASPIRTTNTPAHADPRSVAVGDRILTCRQVRQLTSLSRATIYRAQQAGRFPTPVRLIPSGSRVGWKEAEVRAWLADPLGWNDRDF